MPAPRGRLIKPLKKRISKQKHSKEGDQAPKFANEPTIPFSFTAAGPPNPFAPAATPPPAMPFNFTGNSMSGNPFALPPPSTPKHVNFSFPGATSNSMADTSAQQSALNSFGGFDGTKDGAPPTVPKTFVFGKFGSGGSANNAGTTNMFGTLGSAATPAQAPVFNLFGSNTPASGNVTPGVSAPGTPQAEKPAFVFGSTSTFKNAAVPTAPASGTPVAETPKFNLGDFGKSATPAKAIPAMEQGKAPKSNIFGNLTMPGPKSSSTPPPETSKNNLFGALSTPSTTNLFGDASKPNAQSSPSISDQTIMARPATPPENAKTTTTTLPANLFGLASTPTTKFMFGGSGVSKPGSPGNGLFSSMNFNTKEIKPKDDGAKKRSRSLSPEDEEYLRNTDLMKAIKGKPSNTDDDKSKTGEQPKAVQTPLFASPANGASSVLFGAQTTPFTGFGNKNTATESTVSDAPVSSATPTPLFAASTNGVSGVGAQGTPFTGFGNKSTAINSTVSDTPVSSAAPTPLFAGFGNKPAPPETPAEAPVLGFGTAATTRHVETLASSEASNAASNAGQDQAKLNDGNKPKLRKTPMNSAEKITRLTKLYLDRLRDLDDDSMMIFTLTGVERCCKFVATFYKGEVSEIQQIVAIAKFLKSYISQIFKDPTSEQISSNAAMTQYIDEVARRLIDGKRFKFLCKIEKHMEVGVERDSSGRPRRLRAVRKTKSNPKGDIVYYYPLWIERAEAARGLMPDTYDKSSERWKLLKKGSVEAEEIVGNSGFRPNIILIHPTESQSFVCDTDDYVDTDEYGADLTIDAATNSDKGDSAGPSALLPPGPQGSEKTQASGIGSGPSGAAGIGGIGQSFISQGFVGFGQQMKAPAAVPPVAPVPVPEFKGFGKASDLNNTPTSNAPVAFKGFSLDNSKAAATTAVAPATQPIPEFKGFGKASDLNNTPTTNAPVAFKGFSLDSSKAAATTAVAPATQPVPEFKGFGKASDLNNTSTGNAPVAFKGFNLDNSKAAAATAVAPATQPAPEFKGFGKGSGLNNTSTGNAPVAFKGFSLDNSKAAAATAVAPATQPIPEFKGFGNAFNSNSLTAPGTASKAATLALSPASPVSSSSSEDDLDVAVAATTEMENQSGKRKVTDESTEDSRPSKQVKVVHDTVAAAENSQPEPMAKPPKPKRLPRQQSADVEPRRSARNKPLLESKAVNAVPEKGADEKTNAQKKSNAGSKKGTGKGKRLSEDTLTKESELGQPQDSGSKKSRSSSVSSGDEEPKFLEQPQDDQTQAPAAGPSIAHAALSQAKAAETPQKSKRKAEVQITDADPDGAKAESQSSKIFKDIAQQSPHVDLSGRKILKPSLKSPTKNVFGDLITPKPNPFSRPNVSATNSSDQRVLSGALFADLTPPVRTTGPGQSVLFGATIPEFTGFNTPLASNGSVLLGAKTTAFTGFNIPSLTDSQGQSALFGRTTGVLTGSGSPAPRDNTWKGGELVFKRPESTTAESVDNESAAENDSAYQSKRVRQSIEEPEILRVDDEPPTLGKYKVTGYSEARQKNAAKMQAEKAKFKSLFNVVESDNSFSARSSAEPTGSSAGPSSFAGPPTSAETSEAVSPAADRPELGGASEAAGTSQLLPKPSLAARMLFGGGGEGSETSRATSPGLTTDDNQPGTVMSHAGSDEEAASKKASSPTFNPWGAESGEELLKEFMVSMRELGPGNRMVGEKVTGVFKYLRRPGGEVDGKKVDDSYSYRFIVRNSKQSQAVLNRAFVKIKPSLVPSKPDNLFITMGGSTPDTLSRWRMKAVDGAEHIDELVAIIGRQFEDAN